MSKKPRSFSIDRDINEILKSRDDLNASAAVNNFLRQYVSSGKGEEAALEIRLNQLDEEIADLNKELEQKKRERERINAQLESRRSALSEMLNKVEKKVRKDAFPEENVEEQNPAIQNWANQAGVDAEHFVNKLEARL